MKLATVTRLAVYLLLALLLVSNATAQDEDNNKQKVFKIAPIEHGKFGVPDIVPGYDTREHTCDKYARDTVEQLKWLEKMNCDYEKKPWGNTSLLISYNLEYSNCMNSVPRRLGEEEFHLSDISKNIEKRQKAIAMCVCEPYAKSAVAQNSDNVTRGCGYSGPRWSSDFGHHYNWCAHGGGNIIESGSYEKFKLGRANDLAKCIKPLAPIKLAVRNGSDSILDRTPTLTWVDPGAGKAEAADSYWLEILVNGEKFGVPGVIVPRMTFPAGVLPYSALITWKVKGRNNFGDSPWSTTASYRVIAAPVQDDPPTPLKEEETILRGKLQAPYTGKMYYIANLSIPNATALTIYNPNLGLGKQWIAQIIELGASSDDCGKPGKTIDIHPGSSSTQIKGTSLYNFTLGFCLTTTDTFTSSQGLPSIWDLKIKYQ